MVLASIIHLKAFSHHEHLPLHPRVPATFLALENGGKSSSGDGGGGGSGSNNLAAIPKTKIAVSMWDSINMVDILKDIVNAPGEVREVKKMRKERRERKATESRAASLHNMLDDDHNDVESEQERAGIISGAAAMGEGGVGSISNGGKKPANSEFVIGCEEDSLN
ncbi:hypothetical protein HK100_004396 [Physocladia obscura]|uniref:Uncharacterized protein n=1 Tax=Physocladia obscura TaxID=109957 RepID=A0AAD5XDW0_9FUNG|nr:hypothetical protein HK100_004396 [Physocladia obscura]